MTAYDGRTRLSLEELEKARDLLIRARMHVTPGEWEVTRHRNQPTTVHALGFKVATVGTAPDADWMGTMTSPWIWSTFHSLLEYAIGEVRTWTSSADPDVRPMVTSFDEPGRYEESEKVASALLGLPYDLSERR